MLYLSIVLCSFKNHTNVSFAITLQNIIVSSTFLLIYMGSKRYFKKSHRDIHKCDNLVKMKIDYIHQKLKLIYKMVQFISSFFALLNLFCIVDKEFFLLGCWYLWNWKWSPTAKATSFWIDKLIYSIAFCFSLYKLICTNW